MRVVVASIHFLPLVLRLSLCVVDYDPIRLKRITLFRTFGSSTVDKDGRCCCCWLLSHVGQTTTRQENGDHLYTYSRNINRSFTRHYRTIAGQYEIAVAVVLYVEEERAIQHLVVTNWVGEKWKGS